MNKITRLRAIIAFLLTLCSGVSSAGDPVSLRILHLNDFHGYAEPHRPAGSQTAWGGMAFLASEANRLRPGQPTLLLAAGDMVQGNPWTNLFQGTSTIEVMNAMDFTAMVLGNHEFDFGLETLKKLTGQACFPFLAANIEGLDGVRPYIIKELGGVKVAVIGLVTEDTPVATHPKNVSGLTFLPAAESLRSVLAVLNGRADLVVVLSHLGLPADRRLARDVEGIHLIVGGHTHTRMEKPLLINQTFIVQAWEHGKVLGLVDLKWDGRRISELESRLVEIRPEHLTAEPRTALIVENYSRKASFILDQPIGRAALDLIGKGSRERETNLGNFLTDILREEAQADAALLNGGGIRADLPQGPIRMRDLLSVLPFRNHLVVLRLSGQEILEALEYGLSDLSGYGGQFPQVSGIRLLYDPGRPPGSRIRETLIQGKPLNPLSLYRLATIDFLVAGGDGYSLFKKWIQEDRDASRVALFDSGRDIRDVVIDHIKKQETITTAIEGRILIRR
jgi:2',3'-cyclic-nucleotide 2'-phosphodiesterase (5'-nucleotidase family)